VKRRHFYEAWASKDRIEHGIGSARFGMAAEMAVSNLGRIRILIYAVALAVIIESVALESRLITA